MNRDNDRFNKILLVVFILSLAFGAYLFLGPKITSLINSYDQINEMNLSGTFRVYMFVQFISLGISTSILITSIFTLILTRIGWKPNAQKGLIRYLAEFFGLLSVGGAVINVAWMIYFVNQSYARFIEKDHSKDSLLKGIIHSPFTLKEQYQKFFNDTKKYTYLKGMLSLLFWAILSLFLTAIIRWQAGTNGCEYSWRGDTQHKSAIEAEAKFFGYPIRHFVKIPESDDIDYLDYTKRRIEFPTLSDAQRIDDNHFNTKYADSKTCWRRFILGIVLFYAVFLRIVLAFFFFILYKCADLANAKSTFPTQNNNYVKSQKTEGAKPFPNVLNVSVAADTLPPFLLLTFGFGIDISQGLWLTLFHNDELKDSVICDNVMGGEKGTTYGTNPLDSQFTEWLNKKGGLVSDVIFMIDLCKVPIVDDLDILSNKIFQNLTQLRKCVVILSNGENLRVMSSNPVAVEERIEDWKDKLSKLFCAICENRCKSFSFEFIDWFDLCFRTLNADLKLADYLRNEFPNRFAEGKPNKNDQRFPSFYSTALKIILNSFDRYTRESNKLELTAVDWGDQFKLIFNRHLEEGESRLTSLYTTGKDPSISNEIIDGATEFVGNVLEKGKKVFAHGKLVAEDLNETFRGNPVLIRKASAGFIKKFIPQMNIDKPADKTIRYNANRAFSSIITEYALTLEMQGISLAQKVQLIDQMMDRFTSTSLFFERDDLEFVLSQISDQIKNDKF